MMVTFSMGFRKIRAELPGGPGGPEIHIWTPIGGAGGINHGAAGGERGRRPEGAVRDSMGTMSFGQAAISLGLVTEADVQDCTQVQRKMREMGVDEPL